MRRREKPPRWFKWAIWAGMLLSVAVPTACVLNHGTVPGYGTLPSLVD
ncbi:MAG TPA: hypothetical protein VMQ93_14295 [Novosphingobium sp.]|nr:hypothetical protein [Novosphingobium sp.]